MTSRLTTSITKPCAAMSVAFALMALTGAAQAAADTTRVIVSFKPGSAAAAAARAAIAHAGGRVKLEIIGGEAVAVELPRKMLAALKRNVHIDAIEEDARRVPMAALTTPSQAPYRKGQLVPYGIKMVQADQMPEGDKLAANRKVCIIDSGYDNTHEDLAGNDVTGEFDSGTGWWYTDENHHGTHVAGTIAGINNLNTGVIGVLPTRKLKLHIVKVFGADSWAYSSNLINATKKCEAAGANIITMSLGGPLPNNAESKQFGNLKAAGILSIAAAGNGGNTLTSYPAGYSAVMSVAAIDVNRALASFSQRNKDVEIAGPGVAVLSTVPMGTGEKAEVSVGSTSYDATGMAGSPKGSATAPLADFGFGDVISSMTGKVCLISRGNIDFATKVSNCEASGGVGAIVYNNVPGAFGGTLGDVTTGIPSVTASDTDGAAMQAQLGQATTVAVTAWNYAYFDGTSMATPAVAAAAALVWSYFPSCSNEQIRSTLNKSALDLGAVGRDNSYGYGLVQAKAAYDRLNTLGCQN